MAIQAACHFLLLRINIMTNTHPSILWIHCWLYPRRNIKIWIQRLSEWLSRRLILAYNYVFICRRKHPRTLAAPLGINSYKIVILLDKYFVSIWLSWRLNFSAIFKTQVFTALLLLSSLFLFSILTGTPILSGWQLFSYCCRKGYLIQVLTWMLILNLYLNLTLIFYSKVVFIWL